MKIKLSKAQNELLGAMQKGARVRWMGGYKSYAWRSDNGGLCSHTIKALETRGLVAQTALQNGNAIYDLTESGKSFAVT